MQNYWALLAWLCIFNLLWCSTVLTNIQCGHHLFINFTFISMENLSFFPSIWNTRKLIRISWKKKKRIILWTEQWKLAAMMQLLCSLWFYKHLSGYGQKTGACCMPKLPQPVCSTYSPSPSVTWQWKLLASVPRVPTKTSIDNNSWSHHSETPLSGLSL